MPVATTRFETPYGARYLARLCKHFGHKVEVAWSEREGRCALPPGPAQLNADEGGLDVRVEAGDAEGLRRAMHIVEDHLLRFAFRESPSALTWKEESAS